MRIALYVCVYNVKFLALLIGSCRLRICRRRITSKQFLGLPILSCLVGDNADVYPESGEASSSSDSPKVLEYCIIVNVKGFFFFYLFVLVNSEPICLVRYGQWFAGQVDFKIVFCSWFFATYIYVHFGNSLVSLICLLAVLFHSLLFCFWLMV